MVVCQKVMPSHFFCVFIQRAQDLKLSVSEGQYKLSLLLYRPTFKTPHSTSYQEENNKIAMQTVDNYGI